MTAVFVGVPGCVGGGDGAAFVDNNGDFLANGRTLSHFEAIQIDPRSEDSAGPQFVVAEDLNDDGLIDLVSAWNQSQPVQVHLQRRPASDVIRFETLTLAGNVPVIAVAGLAVVDLDADARPDIAVLVKSSALEGPACMEGDTPEMGLSGIILTYLSPAEPAQTNQALAWKEVAIGASFLQGSGEASGPPEVGGYTCMAVGDIDSNGMVDLAATWNSGCGGGTTDVVVFTNQGPNGVRDGRWAAKMLPDSFVKGTVIKDVALGDIDRDGDLDVVVTLPDAPAANIRWFRNPARDVPDDYHFTEDEWQVGTIGQIAMGADIVRLSDVDRDGILDAVVRSSEGGLIQWFKGPPGPTTAPVRAIPWQVYTLAEFLEREPQALVVGDMNSDGYMEVVSAAEGGLMMFESREGPSLFDPWTEQFIIDDRPPENAPAAVAPVAGVPVVVDPAAVPQAESEGTLINSVLIVDIDGDGSDDIVATLDRGELSGLNNDALVWFRNTTRP